MYSLKHDTTSEKCVSFNAGRVYVIFILALLRNFVSFQSKLNGLVIYVETSKCVTKNKTVNINKLYCSESDEYIWSENNSK